MGLIEWAAKLRTQPGSPLEVMIDVAFGVIAGSSRAVALAWHSLYLNVIHPLALSYGIELKTKEVLPPGTGTIKVAALGYGRTGTYSLMLALTEMGFPTVHTILWYKQVEVLQQWHKDVVLPSIQAKQVLMGSPDFQRIADFGYEALADLPMSLYFEQLVEQFPHCKFILTTRDTPEIWYQSWVVMTKSITKFIHIGGLVIPTLRMYSDYLRWLFAYLNQDASILTMPWPATDETNPKTSMRLYEQHNQRVRELVPPDRLLEYNVRDGWEPLCAFLQIESCPTTPFPKSNSKLSMRVQALSAFVLGITALYVIFYYGMWCNVIKPFFPTTNKKKKKTTKSE